MTGCASRSSCSDAGLSRSGCDSPCLGPIRGRDRQLRRRALRAPGHPGRRVRAGPDGRGARSGGHLRPAPLARPAARRSAPAADAHAGAAAPAGGHRRRRDACAAVYRGVLAGKRPELRFRSFTARAGGSRGPRGRQLPVRLPGRGGPGGAAGSRRGAGLFRGGAWGSPSAGACRVVERGARAGGRRPGRAGTGAARAALRDSFHSRAGPRDRDRTVGAHGQPGRL